MTLLASLSVVGSTRETIDDATKKYSIFLSEFLQNELVRNFY